MKTFSGNKIASQISIIKLSFYLKETEEKLQTERNLLKLLATDLKIIMDSLTTDGIQIQGIHRNPSLLPDLDKLVR